MLSVTTTPSKPSRSRSRPVTIARRLGGDPARVDAADRARARASRAARRHRSRRGTGPGRALRSPSMRRRGVVGVHGGAAEAGEVLGGGGQPRRPHALDRRRACGRRSPPGRRRTRASASPRPCPSGTSATGARFTFTPAVRSCRAAARAARRTSAGWPWNGWPATGPAQPTVRISPPSWSTMTSAPLRALRWSAPRKALPLRRLAAVGPEQDHARGLARAQAAADVRRAVTCPGSSRSSAGRPAGAG